MADKKISALTAATTPLAGTEVLPIVQSGSTVKVSIADVTAGRDVAMQSFDVSLPFYDPNGRPRVRTTSSGADPILEWDRWSGVGTNFNGARFAYDGTSFSFANAPTGSIGSLSFTTRMEINATGDVKANTGNLVIGTTAKGITTGSAIPLGLGVNNSVTAVTIDTNSNVGIGTALPAATALLDVQSTTKGVRFPNMTTAQKTAITPSAGTVIFDTTLSKLCVYSGAAWQTITSV